MARPKIHPVVWTPPPAPGRARQPHADPVMPEPDLLPVDGVGPEDVAVGPDGTLFTGVEDGRILRLRQDRDGAVELVADTGGRPLGIESAPDGALIVCDADRGLLRVDPPSGHIETLVSEVGGRRLLLCDNAAVAADGSVYFSDSSQRFTLAHWRADLLEHSGTGRLLRWRPGGGVEVLLDGLQFANGVALAADESFVAVAETGSYRISRLWLTGPEVGRRDVLIDNLPGFPDNISTGAQGRIWIAIASPRDRMLDWAHRKNPVVRKAVWAMPVGLQPQPKRTAWVMAVDATGQVVRDVQRSGAGYHMVTGVREHGTKLYLGSLVERAVAVVDNPA
jgi:sugar lactone lactonase YvrE